MYTSLFIEEKNVSTNKRAKIYRRLMTEIIRFHLLYNL